MRGDRSYRLGPVQITRHFVDWHQSGPDFSDFALRTYGRIRSMPPGTQDHFYFNPAYTVTAAGSVPEDIFLEQAERACILWMKQLDRVLRPRARKKAARKASHNERMLVFSGTLILHGRPAHIKRLNRSSSPQTQAAC